MQLLFISVQSEMATFEQGHTILVLTEDDSIALTTVKTGAIVQSGKHLYQLEYKNNKYCWTFLPQKRNAGATDASVMIAPDPYPYC